MSVPRDRDRRGDLRADGLIQFCSTDRTRVHTRHKDRVMLSKLFSHHRSSGKWDRLLCNLVSGARGDHSVTCKKFRGDPQNFTDGWLQGPVRSI